MRRRISFPALVAVPLRCARLTAFACSIRWFFQQSYCKRVVFCFCNCKLTKCLSRHSAMQFTHWARSYL